MSDMQVIFGFLFLAIMLGAMWSSYKIGFTEGTGKMIEFCKTKSKNGLVTIHFFGENIDCLLYTSDAADE